jgi:hypothetical protein
MKMAFAFIFLMSFTNIQASDRCAARSIYTIEENNFMCCPQERIGGLTLAIVLALLGKLLSNSAVVQMLLDLTEVELEKLIQDLINHAQVNCPQTVPAQQQLQLSQPQPQPLTQPQLQKPVNPQPSLPIAPVVQVPQVLNRGK